MSQQLGEIPDNSITETKLDRHLSARIGALFSTTSELIADIDLDYEALSVGDTIFAQGFRYEVAAADAKNHHLITKGGLKLSVLPDASERISLSAFDADSAGRDDCLFELQTAVRAANVAGATLVARGRFKLVGSGNVEVTTDCDFSGAIFDCSLWSGRFTFGRSKEVKTYTSGPVVNGLMASTDLDAGSSVFSGWSQCAEVRDSFVIINTEQDFYSYRSTIRKRIEFNRVYKDGIVSSPLKYSMRGIAVSSVKVFPMEDRRRSINGLTLDIRGNDINAQFVLVTTSLLDLDIRFIQDENAQKLANPTFVHFSECCQVKARVEMQWANRTDATTGYTYNLNLQNCYDLDITPHADGDGWGATGNNLCQRITFRDGILNRIDFHQPFMEWLRLRNMVVGNWGVLVTALGTLDLDTVAFHVRTLKNSSGIIRSRTDTGGFCDGDLLMRNITVVVDKRSGSLNLLKHQQSTGTGKPANTPIQYRWWRRIIIDGLEYRTPLTTQKLLINPGLITTGSAPISVCEEFTLHNAHGSGLCVTLDLKGRTPSKEGVFPLKIDLENIVGEVIETKSDNARCRVSASIRNCRGIGRQDGILIKALAPGEYTIVGGCISRLDHGNPVAPVLLRAYGATVVDPQDGAALIVANGNFDACLTDCTFHTSVLDRLSSLLNALLERPTFFVNGIQTEWNISNDLNNSELFTLVHSPRIGQKVRLVMGLSSTNSLATVELIIPPTGYHTVVPGFNVNNGGTAELGLLQRINDTQIKASGNIRFRRLQLGNKR
ncbi:hypothetical protein [Pseudomonas alkylphenolica]|uniref:hypothetical protein n=1 Tax=Pseudomonas alkylphenolica TaxID=237609 RepID=UPI0018D89C20|nr:hypothetical protein [Pseudomonas alkylphenolica]MBH3430154.1 hypothetical protein [Pseudomonas alkylphenolica]